jgi:predicted dehydrogenase
VPAEGWIELDLELRFRRDAWGAHQVHDEALLDAGIHLVDLACYLATAPPIAVRHAEIAHERATLELELTRGRARIRCATDRRHRETVVVRDRSGTVLARSFVGGTRGRMAALTGRRDPLQLSLQRQLAALRNPPRCAAQLAGAVDGVVAMGVVEAARRSAQLGGAEVAVAPVEASA